MPTGYLNGLTRAQYRELFSEDFEILEEHVRYPNLGSQYLTENVAAELSGFGEEELFSNQVQFVLKPRRRKVSIARSITHPERAATNAVYD